MKRETEKVLIAFLVAFLAIFTIALSNEYSYTVRVNVTVEEAVIIEVSPLDLSFRGKPGELAIPHVAYITVTNLGSVPIQRIKVRSELPSSNPWGQGNPALHRSGEFVLIRNSSVQYGYISQRLFPMSNIPRHFIFPQECLTGGTFDNSKCRLFVFKTANVTVQNQGEDWFVLAISNNGNFASGSVRFSRVPRTAANPGNYDFTNTNHYEERALTVVGSYGYTEYVFGNNQMLRGYFIIRSDATETYFGYWDYDVTSKVNLPINYLLPVQLRPAEFTTFELQVRIPYGVPAGTVTGNIYIVAER